MQMKVMSQMNSEAVFIRLSESCEKERKKAIETYISMQNWNSILCINSIKAFTSLLLPISKNIVPCPP